jgi:ELWxxDGT repeat protein
MYNPLTRTYKLKTNQFGYNLICKTYKDPRTAQYNTIPYVYNDKLYYVGYASNSNKIYSVDTSLVANFQIDLPFNCSQSINTFNLWTIVNNKLIVIPDQNLTNLPSTGSEPYYYDFETNTTGILKDINPYFNYGSSVELIHYSYFYKTEEKLTYFFAYNPDYGRELYFTDGSPSGTNMTRDTKQGTADLCSGSCSGYYKGDTLILMDHYSDTIRVYYKNTYYQKFKKPSTPNSTSATIRSYISLGNDVYYNMNSNSNAIYKLGNENPIANMVCAFPDLNTYNLFLKKDTCLYFSATSNSCIPNTTTGYELFKYCNGSIYSTPQTEINEMVFSNTKITAYPNPTTGKIKFINVNDSVLLEIYDITGKIILTDKKIMQEQEYDLSLINKGIYFYKITSKNKEISTGKLIIQ